MYQTSEDSGSNWNLEVLAFEERGKPEYPEKNLSEKRREENQQQTQATYDADSGNRTRATLVGGECSHHCAIPAPLINNTIIDKLKFFLSFYYSFFTLEEEYALYSGHFKQSARLRMGFFSLYSVANLSNSHCLCSRLTS